MHRKYQKIFCLSHKWFEYSLNFFLSIHISKTIYIWKLPIVLHDLNFSPDQYSIGISEIFLICEYFISKKIFSDKLSQIWLKYVFSMLDVFFTIAIFHICSVFYFMFNNFTLYKLNLLVKFWSNPLEL